MVTARTTRRGSPSGYRELVSGSTYPMSHASADRATNIPEDSGPRSGPIATAAAFLPYVRATAST